MAEGELTGTWRLVSWELRDESGEVTYPLGPDAGGRLTYTADGRMSVLITARGRKPYASGDMFGATADEAESVAGRSIAYCGTYERRGDTVMHHVELSTFPNWEQTEQGRLISWQDGRLILSTNSLFIGGKQQVALLIWEPVELPETQ